ncbi:MAG: radical SAM protein, partial [Planctomycetes bacterium]|nr:radical SAM protein [Planctomycetota bacterium]
DLQAVETLIPTFPLKIQIQTTTRCNAACTMCPYPEVTTEEGFQHGIMREELFQSLLDELCGRPVERVSLFLMNEPLLDRRMPEWLARARAALPEVTLSLFTNGSALDLERALALADAGLDELCISVHGFTASTYEDVMRGLSFDRARDHVTSVLCAAEAGDLGTLQVHLIAGDVEPLRANAEHAQVDWAERVLWKGFSNERDAARVGREPARGGAARTVCQRPFVKLYVLTTGECVLCNVDWRRTVVLGRLGPGEQTIDQVWNGAAYRMLRREHLLATLQPGMICQRCDYASKVDGE